MKTDVDKLKELMGKCKCGVYVAVNEHRDYYQDASDGLKDKELILGDLEIDYKVRAKMIELNTIIEITFYPHSPISSYRIFHYDLELALDEALALCK